MAIHGQRPAPLPGAHASSRHDPVPAAPRPRPRPPQQRCHALVYGTPDNTHDGQHRHGCGFALPPARPRQHAEHPQLCVEALQPHQHGVMSAQARGVYGKACRAPSHVSERSARAPCAGSGPFFRAAHAHAHAAACASRAGLQVAAGLLSSATHSARRRPCTMQAVMSSDATASCRSTGDGGTCHRVHLQRRQMEAASAGGMRPAEGTWRRGR